MEVYAIFYFPFSKFIKGSTNRKQYVEILLAVSRQTAFCEKNFENTAFCHPKSWKYCRLSSDIVEILLFVRENYLFVVLCFVT